MSDRIMMCTSDRLALLSQLADAGVVTPAQAAVISQFEVAENMKRFELVSCRLSVTLS